MEGKIYSALSSIQQEITFIGKDRQTATNGSFKGYKYRGIDDVYEHLNPLFKKYGVVIMPQPNLPEDKFDIRHDGNTIEVFGAVRIRLVCVSDGSYIDGVGYGSAKDTGGTVAGKLLSYAVKFFMFTLFLIPTDDPDSDSETYSETKQKPERAESKPIVNTTHAHSQIWTDSIAMFDKVITDGKCTKDMIASISANAFGKVVSQLSDDEILSLRMKLEEIYGDAQKEIKE